MAKPTTPPIYTTPGDAAHAFYQAFEARDLDAMMATWADDEEIVCVHPGGTRLVGYAAVRAGWEQLFSGDTPAPVPARRDRRRRNRGPRDPVLGRAHHRRPGRQRARASRIAPTSSCARPPAGGWSCTTRRRRRRGPPIQERAALGRRCTGDRLAAAVRQPVGGGSLDALQARRGLVRVDALAPPLAVDAASRRRESGHARVADVAAAVLAGPVAMVGDARQGGVDVAQLRAVPAGDLVVELGGGRGGRAIASSATSSSTAAYGDRSP